MSMFRLIALMVISRALAAHNIAVRDEWIVDGGYTHETALKAARQLLSQSPLPEAVFATDSLKLMSIYRAAAEKKYCYSAAVSGGGL